MNRHLFLSLLLALFASSTLSADNLKIEPAFWWSGMKNPELQLMVYGEGIGNAAVSVNYPGVSLSSTVKLESNNYLLVYLKLDKDVKPGKFNLTFTEGKKKLVKEYELKARNKKGCEHKGFDASDALYLLMPDRFANGNPDNDQIAGMAEYKIDRNDPNARHGGDLAGITQKLPYLQSLGVTCLYLNPIFEAHSNHRYNTADYRKIDPLLGTEEDFADLCAQAKKLGISVILDGVFSHTGSDSVYFNQNGRYGEHSGAYRDSNSPYREWYSFKRYPDDYECWWGFKTLPNVRETQPDYMDFICNPKTGVLAKWLTLGAIRFSSGCCR